MKIVLIAAVGKNYELGKDNDLLWRLPRDMKFFKETTRGFPIMTGRKNYESIPLKFRPLPGRRNVVITTQKNYNGIGADVVSNLRDALISINKEKTYQSFIIGGGQIYKMALDNDIVDEVLLTHVDGEFDADVYLEGFNPDDWPKKEVLKRYRKDDTHKYAFEIVRYSR